MPSDPDFNACAVKQNCGCVTNLRLDTNGKQFIYTKTVQRGNNEHQEITSAINQTVSMHIYIQYGKSGVHSASCHE